MAVPALRAIFDSDADGYDRARPGYPASLFADLTELTGLGPATSVIEVGPGTGQATRDLAATGARITAVELGAGLAERLRSNLRGADVLVVQSAFEDWTPPERVDLLACFTSWHWVDSAVRAQRVRDALHAGGHLATVATSHVRGGTVNFFERAQDCYLRWDPATDPAERLLAPDELGPITDEVDESPLFAPPIRRRYLRDLSYRTDQYLALLLTYSGHRALAPERRRGLLGCLRALIDEHYDGMITKRYLYELRVARAV